MTSNFQDLLPILIPILILELTLMTVALFHLLNHKDEVRGNFIVWIIVIVMINILGPILYFAFGRKK